MSSFFSKVARPVPAPKGAHHQLDALPPPPPTLDLKDLRFYVDFKRQEFVLYTLCKLCNYQKIMKSQLNVIVNKNLRLYVHFIEQRERQEFNLYTLCKLSNY